MPLVVGLSGKALGEEERQTLERIQPAGVILFARNIATAEQTRALLTSVKELEPRPFVSVDLEGGIVNRLSSLWGELPAPAEAAARQPGRSSPRPPSPGGKERPLSVNDECPNSAPHGRSTPPG